jgi:hypothetical protein
MTPDEAAERQRTNVVSNDPVAESVKMYVQEGDKRREVYVSDKPKDVAIRPPTQIDGVVRDGIKGTVLRHNDGSGKEEFFETYTAPTAAKSDGFKQTDVAKAAQDEGNKLRDDVKGYREVVDSAGDAKELLAKAQTNPAATAPAMRRVARLFEKGVLSDADVKDYGGSQAVFDQLMRYSEKASNGTLTAEDAQNATEIVDVALARAQTNMETMTGEAVDRFAYNYDIPRDQAYQRLTGRKYSTSKGGSGGGDQKATKPESGTAIAAPAGTAENPAKTIETIDEILRRRGQLDDKPDIPTPGGRR